MVTLSPAKISGEGLVYPLETDGYRLEVLVAMNADGQGWLVRFDVGGNQLAGNGASPLAAFRIAADLAQSALTGSGPRLDVEGIEKTLTEQDALTPVLPIPLPLSALAALGIKHAFPQPVDPALVEKHLRVAEFMQRTRGVRSPHWHVIGGRWDDFGRELHVTVRLGR